MSITFIAQASATDTQFISIEECKSAIQDVGEKYGINCELQNYDPSDSITQADLEETLAKLDKTLSEIDSFEVTIEPVNASDNLDSLVVDMPLVERSMPVRDTFYSDETYRILYPTGYAYLRARADVTVDAQNANIITVHDADVYQYGASLNFYSWDTYDIDWTENVPRAGMLDVDFVGTVRYNIVDTGLGDVQASVDCEGTLNVQCW